MSAEDIRVRFAPSPTGSLHIGGARTALFNWLFARGRKGQVILRVEDTDVERSTEESERAVLEDLRWLGLEWDEGPDTQGDLGPYRQSERTELYRGLARKLVEGGLAYSCFCTEEELASRRQKAKEEAAASQYDGTCRDLTPDEIQTRLSAKLPYTIRFRVPTEESITVHDLIRGDVEFGADVLGDFVILRSNGIPTYNFAVVVDDHGMKISHVIRGEEHLSNTNRQILLYRALGYPIPAFAHISLILNPDRSKMSKRSGEAATFVSEFRDLGYIPEALLNYLVLLGWSLDGETEFFSIPDLIEHFSLERVNPTPAIFDREKLEWMNWSYLKDMPLDERIRRVSSYLDKYSPERDRYRDNPRLEKAVQIVGDRLRTLRDFELYAGFAFQDSVDVDEKARAEVLKKAGSKENLKALAEMVRGIEQFSPEALEEAARSLAERMGTKPGKLFFPARIALTGKKIAPGLFDVMDLLGRDLTVERLDAALGWFEEVSADS